MSVQLQKATQENYYRAVMVIFPLAPDQTIAQMWSNGARGGLLPREEEGMGGLDWIVQCFTSPPTQYRLYGRRFLQVKRPNQQYQSTEGSYKWEEKATEGL